MVIGCSKPAPLGRFRPALVSLVGTMVAAITRGMGGGVEIVVVIARGGVKPWGMVDKPKIWARVTLPFWKGILIGESSKGVASGMVSTSWEWEGLWLLVLPVFFFLLQRARSAEVGMATVTSKSLGVKGGGELLRYQPSSRSAHSGGERMYPLQRMSMYGSKGCLMVTAFPSTWKLWYTEEYPRII